MPDSGLLKSSSLGELTNAGNSPVGGIFYDPYFKTSYKIISEIGDRYPYYEVIFLDEDGNSKSSNPCHYFARNFHLNDKLISEPKR